MYKKVWKLIECTTYVPLDLPFVVSSPMSVSLRTFLFCFSLQVFDINSNLSLWLCLTWCNFLSKVNLSSSSKSTTLSLEMPAKYSLGNGIELLQSSPNVPFWTLLNHSTVQEKQEIFGHFLFLYSLFRK